MKRLFAILLAVVMVFSLCACDSADYKKASEAMDSGDYAAASEAFKALGDYKDSAEKAKECDYQLALAVFESADYAAAIAAFEALGGYADSADYIAKAKDEIVRAAVPGQWVCSGVDLTEEFMVGLEAAMAEDAEILDSCELPPLLVDMCMEIFDKGTFSATVDTDSFMESMTGILDAVKAGLQSYLVTELEAALTTEGLSMEDLYSELDVSNEDELIIAILGMSIDELFDSMGLEDTLSTAMDSSAVSGVWEVAGETLTLTVGEEYETAVYDAAADTVTVTEGSGTGTYPQIYTRK